MARPGLCLSQAHVLTSQAVRALPCQALLWRALAVTAIIKAHETEECVYAVFCYAMFCCWCASYTNRKELLRGDMTRYQCCNGDWPCSGKMKEKDCPEFCLCIEVHC